MVMMSMLSVMIMMVVMLFFVLLGILFVMHLRQRLHLQIVAAFHRRENLAAVQLIPGRGNDRRLFVQLFNQIVAEFDLLSSRFLCTA